MRAFKPDQAVSATLTILSTLKHAMDRASSIKTMGIRGIDNLLWSVCIFDHFISSKAACDLVTAFNEAMDGYVIEPIRPILDIQDRWVLGVACTGEVFLSWIDDKQNIGYMANMLRMGNIYHAGACSDIMRECGVWPIREGYLPPPSRSDTIYDD